MNSSPSYLLALLLILTGCSSEIEIGENPHPKDEVSVPILIVPTRIEGSTKASITAFDNENDATHIGIYGKSGEDILYNGISPSGLNNNQLVFQNPPLVYPVDGKNVTLSGYYPCRSENGEEYTIKDGVVSFNLTGQEDLLYASEMDAGSKSSPKSVNLQFVHKLTRIEFKLKTEITGLTSEDLIQISTNVPSKGTMDLSNGSITAGTDLSTFTLSTGIAIKDLTATAIQAKGEFLLLPFNSSNVLQYDFKLSVKGVNYKIQLDETNKPDWKEGTSYMLTITIKSLSNPIASKTDPGNSPSSGSFIQGIITQQE